MLGKCEMCLTLGVELERVPEDLCGWPLYFCCAPCLTELRQDDEDPTDHEARDAVG